MPIIYSGWFSTDTPFRLRNKDCAGLMDCAECLDGARKISAAQVRAAVVFIQHKLYFGICSKTMLVFDEKNDSDTAFANAHEATRQPGRFH